MGFPTAHLSKDFAHSSGLVAAGFAVEKTVEQQHKETQEREMDRVNLTGAEEFAARGSINVASAKLEAEKKKKDSEKVLLQSALEQQRQQMLDQLNNRIGKLTKEIERDQLKLEVMRNKRSALDDLGKLVDAGKITRETPHHDVLDRAGIQDKEKIINSDKDKQKDIIQEEVAKLDPQINELVEKIDANMNKLTLLTEALDDLDAIDPDSPEAEAKMADISARLNSSGIDITGKSVDDALGIVESSREESYDQSVSMTNKFRELNALEQVAFIKAAEKTGQLPSDKLQGYKDTMKDEAKTILEADLKPQQPISAPAI